MNRPDKRKRIWAVGLFVLAMGLTCGFLSANKTNKVNATLAGWNASNIITDYVMTDYGSMNESQIQSFLKSKVNCNNTELWRRQSTKVTWNIKDGHFVCMADDRFNGETAAHIIWQAAQDYRINPKVLIVTLQKESSLITDSMPHSGQYRTAMGFGCPDTAACDAKYFGLKNQIRNAARFFRAYQDNASGWYKPYWTGSYKVHWHPDLNRCGGTVLNIQNRATASLYSYTPYQPNQAALNAGWGTGDTCSAYGNRNFYNYFTSWFGDTRKNITKTKTTFPKGSYRLVFSNDYNMTLQLAVASSANRTNIVVSSRKNSTLDSFTLSRNTDGSFAFVNNFSNSSIDTPNANAVVGQEMKQWEKSKAEAEKFFIYDNGDGTYSIASKIDPSLVLTKRNDGQIILDLYANSIDQKFKFVQVVQPIENGFYNITSGVNHNSRALNVRGGSTANGTNVLSWNKNHSRAQMWRVHFDSYTGYYEIKTISGDARLEISNSSKNNGANAQIWKSSTVCAQKWQIVSYDAGYKLLNACSGKALDVSGGSQKNGANVQLYQTSPVKAQEWKFEKLVQEIPNGNYKLIVAVDPVYGLSINSQSDDYNVFLQSSQIKEFKITYNNNNGFYRIEDPQTGENLNVVGNSVINGTNVNMATKNNTAAQAWKIWKNTDGSFRITSALGSSSIDISRGVIKNETNIQLWGDSGVAAQKWLFK